MTVFTLFDVRGAAAIAAALTEVTWKPGSDTAPVAAARGIKANLQARAIDDEKTAQLSAQVSAALQRNTAFQRYAMPSKLSTPMFVRYERNMYYGRHLDAASSDNIRCDLAVTVGLSDGYEGGQLMLEDGCRAVDVPVGSAIVYPADDWHEVTPVVQGVRIVAVAWVQSRVRDPRQRKIITDLEEASRKTGSDTVRRCYQNLVRMWAEP